jgi:hypothetical protein
VTPGASSSSIPSQNTPPSLVDATFVKIVFRKIVFIALGFVLLDVPGKVVITCREKRQRNNKVAQSSILNDG